MNTESTSVPTRRNLWSSFTEALRQIAGVAASPSRSAHPAIEAQEPIALADAQKATGSTRTDDATSIEKSPDVQAEKVGDAAPVDATSLDLDPLHFLFADFPESAFRSHAPVAAEPRPHGPTEGIAVPQTDGAKNRAVQGHRGRQDARMKSRSVKKKSAPRKPKSKPGSRDFSKLNMKQPFLALSTRTFNVLASVHLTTYREVKTALEIRLFGDVRGAGAGMLSELSAWVAAIERKRADKRTIEEMTKLNKLSESARGPIDGIVEAPPPPVATYDCQETGESRVERRAVARGPRNEMVEHLFRGFESMIASATANGDTYAAGYLNAMRIEFGALTRMNLIQDTPAKVD